MLDRFGQIMAAFVGCQALYWGRGISPNPSHDGTRSLAGAREQTVSPRDCAIEPLPIVTSNGTLSTVDCKL